MTPQIVICPSMCLVSRLMEDNFTVSHLYGVKNSKDFAKGYF